MCFVMHFWGLFSYWSNGVIKCRPGSILKVIYQARIPFFHLVQLLHCANFGFFIHFKLVFKLMLGQNIKYNGFDLLIMLTFTWSNY